MKKALLIIAALVSTRSFAQQCDVNPEVLKADYKITNTKKAQQTTDTLILWRNQQQVAQQGEVMTELWQHLTNNQLRPIRYFNVQQRGIEYQPSEVRGVQNWSAKTQLVDNHLIKKMTLISIQGEGCNKIKNYTLSENGSEFKLAFFTQSKLVNIFSVSNQNGQVSTQLSLINVSSDEAVIADQFSKWDNFQTTDYADIGDNESDPFLAKMINLGFIEHSKTGFYNQDGESIQGGHHH
jgi:hypothetical protein